MPREETDIGPYDSTKHKFQSEIDDDAARVLDAGIDATHLKHQLDEAKDVLRLVDGVRKGQEDELSVMRDFVDATRKRDQLDATQLARHIATDSRGFLNYDNLKDLPLPYLRIIRRVFDHDVNSLYHRIFVDRAQAAHDDDLTVGAWNARSMTWTHETALNQKLDPPSSEHALTGGRWNRKKQVWET